MSQINVDTTTIRKIQSQWSQVQGVANDGYSSCMRSLQNAQAEIDNFYGCMRSRLLRLQGEADRLEREANAEQEDYERQKESGGILPYRSPDEKRKLADKYRQQAKEMEQALSELHSKYKAFLSSKDEFSSAFKKIASSGSDDEQLQKVLTKSLETTEEYNRTLI